MLFQHLMGSRIILKPTHTSDVQHYLDITLLVKLNLSLDKAIVRLVANPIEKTGHVQV